MLFLNHQIGASFGTPLRKRGEIADRSVGDIGQSFLGKKRCVCINRERVCVLEGCVIKNRVHVCVYVCMCVCVWRGRGGGGVYQYQCHLSAVAVV